MSKWKGFVAILLVGIVAMTVGGCAQEAEKTIYEISEEYIRLLWDVDYETFQVEDTTKFAEQYYESGYLEDYLKDPEYKSGENSVKEQKLKSSVLSLEDLGTEEETIERTIYTIQKIRAEIKIHQLELDEPDMSFFEEGGQYTLIYQIYFLDENGKTVTDGYDFRPEDEEFLPSGEKTPLTEEERREIGDIAMQYLLKRYHIDAHTFSPEETWAFYEANLDRDFLDRDEITRQSLERLGDELVQYHVGLTLVDSEISVGEQKKYIYDGVSYHFYYWADASYTFAVEADEAYYTLKSLDKQNTIKERLYFSKDEEGNFRMTWAEYL